MFDNRQFAAIEGKSRRFRNSSKCLKTHCGLNNCPTLAKRVAKEASNKGFDKTLVRSKKLLALALSAHTEILSAARVQ